MFILSLVVHLVGFGVTVGLPRILPRSRPGTPVYVVDLISLPAQATAKSKTAGGRPAKKKPALTPPVKKEEKPIKLPDRPQKDRMPEKPPEPPPKKTPEPPPVVVEPDPPSETPEREEPPAEESSADAGADDAAAAGSVPDASTGAAGGATLGVPGGAGGVMADAYTFYFSLLRRRIESSWQKPIYPPSFSDRRTLLVTVLLGLSGSGRVTSLNLTTPSGYDALDRSILRAVRDAEPFPPFPPQIGRSSLTIPIEFEFKPD
jgi:protein TonB